MKPSEYLLNKEKEIYIDMSVSTTKNIINKLDKRFIDRKELRDKILQKQQILKNNLDFDRNSISNSYLFEKIKSLEEILELLK
jgi:hypothetical protein